MSQPISFRTDFRVEWGHCDPARIVFYPNYFFWFDACFQQWLQHAGLSQALLTERYGVIGTPILEASARFLGSSTDGDPLHAVARIDSFGEKRWRIDYQLGRDDRVLVEGWEVRAWVARVDGRLRSLPVPPAFREALTAASARPAAARDDGSLSPDTPQETP
jgi:acyl-CoA thioesterase FadM